jgi:hypothetical protein
MKVDEEENVKSERFYEQVNYEVDNFFNENGEEIEANDKIMIGSEEESYKSKMEKEIEMMESYKGMAPDFLDDEEDVLTTNPTSDIGKNNFFIFLSPAEGYMNISC